jgi:hypothetical protein
MPTMAMIEIAPTENEIRKSVLWKTQGEKICITHVPLHVHSYMEIIDL